MMVQSFPKNVAAPPSRLRSTGRLGPAGSAPEAAVVETRHLANLN